MITKFKLYENIITDNQIFKISNDVLYMNDEILHYFLLTQIKKTNLFEQKVCSNRFIDGGFSDIFKFFNGDRKYNQQTYTTCFSFNYGQNFSMTVIIKKMKYSNNIIKYYFGGNSGDFSMHSKGMVRATRQINLNIIKHFFPDIKYDKKYRDFLKGKILFSDLITDMSTYNSLISKTEKKFDEYTLWSNLKEFNI